MENVDSSKTMAISKSMLKNPEKWDLSTHYPEGFDRHTFPEGENMPSLVTRREYSVLKVLDPQKGNMWRAVYANTPDKIQKHWAYAHRFCTAHASYLVHQPHITHGICSWKT